MDYWLLTSIFLALLLLVGLFYLAMVKKISKLSFKLWASMALLTILFDILSLIPFYDSVLMLLLQAFFPVVSMIIISLIFKNETFVENVKIPSFRPQATQVILELGLLSHSGSTMFFKITDKNKLTSIFSAILLILLLSSFYVNKPWMGLKEKIREPKEMQESLE